MTEPRLITAASRLRAPRVAWRIGLIAIGLIAIAGVAWRTREGEAIARIVHADPDAIVGDPRLRAVALARGRRVFARACAGCHGEDAKGGTGVPDLADKDRLYGEGKASDIEEIVRHGIRAGDRKGWNLASMPAYAAARPYARYTLKPIAPAQIEDLTQFLLGLAHRATDYPAAARGGALFTDKAGCYDCHLRDARGDAAIGAPDLTDRVWLYGGEHDAIYRSIAQGRAGYSPAFAGRLSAADQRAVAVYVASLAPAGAKSP